MLTRLLLTPLLRGLVILPMGEDKTNQIKQIALARTLFNFILSIILWGEFDASSVQYQFVQEFNSLSFCHFHIGVDGISLYFVLLTTFITPLCLLANWDNLKSGYKYFFLAFLLMETF
jgi:NADH-ubiquinone oxidoreductase chain 4